MAMIKVDTGGVAGLRSMVSTLSNQMEDALDHVRYAGQNLDMKTASSENISARLNALQRRLTVQKSKLEQYSIALGTVNERFSASDKLIAGKAKEVHYLMDSIVFAPNVSTRSSLKLKQDTDEAAGLICAFSGQGAKAGGAGDMLWDILKQAGHMGGLLAVVDGICGLKDGADYKSIGNAAKKTRNFIETLRDDVRKMGKAKRILHPSTYKTAWYKRIFGTTDYFKSIGKASKSTNIKTRWYNNFQKAGAKEISKVTWKGMAIDGVFNAMENYEEYKSGDISAGRAVVETITETAFDTTVNIVLTSAVAATVGATLGATVGAPALLVAAGTVVLKGGLDTLAGWATGGEADFTEAVSDMAIDLGKAVGKGLQKVGKGLSSTMKNLKTGWKSIFA